MACPGKGHWLALLWCFPFALHGAGAGPPESWIPARWQGGPLELHRRGTVDSAVRDTIANWYDPSTLELLEGSPLNCLLVTWSAGADAGLERRQQQLVQAYAAKAHKRGVAIVGLVYPGTDPARAATAAAAAGLDGLALEGEVLAPRNSAVPVIPIAKVAAGLRIARTPIAAVEGVSPSARNLADMGIRGAPSSEPWIQSNVWLVRSFRLAPAWRPVWISYQPEGGSAADYARAVADAAVAGGRWIVALDDQLRANLRRKDPAALAVWRRIGAYLRFGEDWRDFVPYGKLALILDTAAADPEMADEYLKLVARRQVPYRVIARPELSAAALAGFRTVLAVGLAPPTAAEREVLQAFAGQGGLVVAGPTWGNAPQDEPFAEVPSGRGRVAVYRDPDPESVARDMKELSLDESGIMAFNVPSVITYASSRDRRLLVQLLNYSDSPAAAITIRVSGKFKAARLLTPEAAPLDLAVSSQAGQTEVTIPRLALWGGVLLEGEIR